MRRRALHTPRVASLRASKHAAVMPESVSLQQKRHCGSRRYSASESTAHPEGGKPTC